MPEPMYILRTYVHVYTYVPVTYLPAYVYTEDLNQFVEQICITE